MINHHGASLPVTAVASLIPAGVVARNSGGLSYPIGWLDVVGDVLVIDLRVWTALLFHRLALLHISVGGGGGHVRMLAMRAVVLKSFSHHVGIAASGWMSYRQQLWMHSILTLTKIFWGSTEY